MRKILSILVLLTIIFCSGYYYSITTVGSKFTVYALALCICAIIFYIAWKKDLRIMRKRLYYTMYFIIVMVFCSVMNGMTFMDMLVIKHILLLVCALLITSVYSVSEFKAGFVRAMRIISVLAIISYILARTRLVTYFPVIENYNGVEYFHGILFSTMKFSHIISERVNGIFWEPGILATYTVLALLFYEKKDDSTLKCILTYLLFVVIVILSRSGAGLLLLPIVVITKISAYRNSRATVGENLAFYFLLLLCVFLVTTSNTAVWQWIEQYLFAKLDLNSDLNKSERLSSVITDLKIMWNYFPFGTGLTNYAQVSLETAEDVYSSTTSTLTSFLAQYGLLGIPITWTWLNAAFCVRTDKGLFTRIGSAAVIILILLKENHIIMLFMHCLIMYFAYNRNGEENETTPIIA